MMSARIKLRIKIIENAILRLNEYKVNTISKILYSLLCYLIQIAIWKSLLHSKADIYPNMVQYVFFSMCLSVFVCYDTNYVPVIGGRVVYGDIAGDLLRPVSLRTFYFFDFLGTVVFRFFLNLIPLILISRFIMHINVTVYRPLASILSFFLACVLYFLISYTMGLLSFWYVSIGQLHILLDSSITLFSGSIIPLWIIPKWLMPVYKLLPFRYLYYEPINIILGKNDSPAEIILGQIIWIIFFLILSQILFRAGVNKIEVQGG